MTNGNYGYTRKVFISAYGSLNQDFYLDHHHHTSTKVKLGKAIDIAANPVVEIYPLNRSVIIRVDLYL
jgi:hypothetical protein